MTGFARVRGTIGKVEVTISLKTVNHRGLDLHFYTGAEMDPFEPAMRSTIKKHVSRGHLTFVFSWRRRQAGRPQSGQIAPGGICRRVQGGSRPVRSHRRP